MLFSRKNLESIKSFLVFSYSGSDAPVSIQMIREQKAMDDIEAGRFDAAVLKCNNIWASLAGSPHGQHTWDMGTPRKVYQEAGGKFGTVLREVPLRTVGPEAPKPPDIHWNVD